VNRLEDPKMPVRLTLFHAPANGLKLRPGPAVFCDNIGGYAKTLRPNVEHVRRLRGRHSSMQLPLGGGMEFSVSIWPRA